VQSKTEVASDNRDSRVAECLDELGIVRRLWRFEEAAAVARIEEHSGLHPTSGRLNIRVRGILGAEDLLGQRDTSGLREVQEEQHGPFDRSHEALTWLD
jgi:hypothetical protein